MKSQPAPALTTLLSQTGSRNCYPGPDRCGVEATFGSWGLRLLPNELWWQPVLWKQTDFYQAYLLSINAKESCKSKPFDITCCACVLIHVNLYAWLESGCNKPATLEIYSSFSPLWVLTFRMQDDIQQNKKTRSPFQQTRTKRQQWIILFHSYRTKWTELQAWKWPFLRNQETGKTTITVAVVKALSFMHSPRTEFILMIANYSSFFTGAPGNPIGALRRSPIPLLVSQLRQRPRPGSPPY